MLLCRHCGNAIVYSASSLRNANVKSDKSLDQYYTRVLGVPDVLVQTFANPAR